LQPSSSAQRPATHNATHISTVPIAGPVTLPNGNPLPSDQARTMSGPWSSGPPTGATKVSTSTTTARICTRCRRQTRAPRPGGAGSVSFGSQCARIEPITTPIASHFSKAKTASAPAAVPSGAPCNLPTTGSADHVWNSSRTNTGATITHVQPIVHFALWTANHISVT
jgi:hypothetical protein